MRILFIRHGDPDYAVDGLTDKGRTEAGLLAKRIRSSGIDHHFQPDSVSVMEMRMKGIDAAAA